MFYIFNVIFSLLNIFLGWIPFGRMPSMSKSLNQEIHSKGELMSSPYGQYFSINSIKRINGKNMVSKELYTASHTCGGAFCDPRTGLVVIDQGYFSSREATLKEALLAHEFGHCFYQGDGSWMWNSCWCYSIREIQADFYAWRQNPAFAKEILKYINKYLPRRTWRDAYLYASVYLFRVTALKILTMIH